MGAIIFAFFVIPLFVVLVSSAILAVILVAEEIRDIRKGIKEDADSYTVRWR